MRSILRMLCYIESFGPDQATKMNLCVEKDFTKHPEVLALTLEPGMPEEKLSAFACNESETPGTQAFDEIHYSHLPAGLANCPQLQCQEVCGFVNIKAMDASTSTLAPLVEKTTVKSQCYKKADSQTAVFWDLGSAQNVGTVSASPSPGVASIKVYLTSTGPDDALAASSMCGVITPTSKSVECSSKGTARYLAMEPFVDGTCVFGSCSQSWCLMEVDGSAMTQQPIESTGSSFMGDVEAAAPFPEKVDSQLRRQRLPGGKTLQETRQLPSIWTSIPKADVLEALEGYRTFSDLKAPRRPVSSSGNTRKGGVAWKDPHPQPPYSSRQPNPNRYLMYAS
eukprot:symbB.v1.2.012801.t1/scaffold884.1/size313170/13